MEKIGEIEKVKPAKGWAEREKEIAVKSKKRLRIKEKGGESGSKKGRRDNTIKKKGGEADKTCELPPVCFGQSVCVQRWGQCGKDSLAPFVCLPSLSVYLFLFISFPLSLSF